MKAIGIIDTGHDFLAAQTLQEIDLKDHRDIRVLEAKSLFEILPDSCQIVLLNQEVFEASTVGELKAFRQECTTPVLVMAKQIPVLTYQNLISVPGLLIVQKPFTQTTFGTLVTSALDGKVLIPNGPPRFLTNEPVRAIDTKTGLMIQTRMRNYSPTGAFLEYNGISVRVGARLKLDFSNLNGIPARTRLQYDAKVVWIREGKGLRGVGVQFLNEVTI